VEKTVWSCSLSMSSHLVAGLGAALRLADAGRPAFFGRLPVSLFRDCVSSDRSNSVAVSWLQRRSESEIAAVVQLAETSWAVHRQNTSVGANPGSGCTAASNAVSASSHLTVGEKRKAPRLAAFAAG
jgi:hypothetical protein